MLKRICSWLLESPAPSPLLTSVETARVIQREMARTDRTGIEFSLVTLGANFDTPAGTELFAELVEYADGRLRITDDVGFLKRDVIALLLPITEREGAEVVAREFEDKFGDRLTINVYTYPTEWFIDSLSEEAEQFSLSGGVRNRQEALETLMARSQRLPLWKRGIDIVGATCGLVALSPLMLIFGVMIKATSRGPVFFSQRRSGLGGAPFDIFKFRTMVLDADARKIELEALNEQDGPAFKIKDDPRITFVGSLLRKTSLDELPQLLNVLKGDMTLVGPRPLPIEETVKCDSWQLQRLQAVPGLTCTWQLADRSCSFEDWMRMDLRYIRNVSPVADVKLIGRTALDVARLGNV